MRFRTFPAALCAGALLFAACGDDDGGADADVSAALQPYADAIAADFGETQGADLGATDDQLACIGEASAATIGEDRLTAEGPPEDIDVSEDLGAFSLSEAEGLDIANAVFDCIPDAFDRALEDIGETPEAVDCLKDNISEADFIELYAFAIRGEDPTKEDFEALSAAAQECA